MVDAPNNMPPAQPGTDPADKPANFFASRTGRFVIGGAAIVVVLLIAGVVAWMFLSNGSGSAATSAYPVVSAPQGATAASNAGTGTPSEPITDPLQKPLESSFTFRNVFAPTLKQQFPAPETPASTTSGSTGSTATAPSIPADTLYLQSIQTVNGKVTATFLWNGTAYTLAEGESIPDSPWKVLSIGSDSVTMLFGDTEVTLSTGQGLSK